YAKKLDSERVSEQQKQLSLQSLNSDLDSLEIQNLETWIGLKDGRLYKFSLQASEGSAAAIKLEMTFSNYWKKEAVVPPESSIDLVQALFDSYQKLMPK